MKPWEEEWGVGGYGELTYREPDPSLPKGEVFIPWSNVARPTQENLARVDFAAAAPDMARALLAIEWSGNEAGTACPAHLHCDARTGHAIDCALDAALRKAGVR
jgi:hypothetical protein